MKLTLQIPDVLGQVIQTYRRNQGVKVEEMMEVLGASSPHHYSFIENGRSKPSYNTLVAIVRYLDIDPNEFFYPERSQLDSKRSQLIHAIETCSEERLAVLTAIWNGLPPDISEAIDENAAMDTETE